MKYLFILSIFLISCSQKPEQKEIPIENPFGNVDSVQAEAGSPPEIVEEKFVKNEESNIEKAERLLKETEMIKEKLEVLKQMKEENEKLKCQAELDKKKIQENSYIKMELDSIKSKMDSLGY